MKNFFGLVKVGVLALVNEAEEQILGEKAGPQRKAWVRAALIGVLKNAGLYGTKLFGVLSLDGLFEAAIDALIEWAVRKLKEGLDRLEKL